MAGLNNQQFSVKLSNSKEIENNDSASSCFGSNYYRCYVKFLLKFLPGEI